MIVEPAAAADARDIAMLVNSAYRGAGAARGWTHEAALLDGQRTDEVMVGALIGRPPGAVLLLRDGGAPGPAGCVSVEPTRDPATWSIGMLTVDPARQAAGLGRRLLEAAERHAGRAGADRIEMTVIASRAALIAWYVRRGYRPTGETRPFPYGDDRFGRPRTGDLRFVVLAKDRVAGR